MCRIYFNENKHISVAADFNFCIGFQYVPKQIYVGIQTQYYLFKKAPLLDK